MLEAFEARISVIRIAVTHESCLVKKREIVQEIGRVRK
jgi:hypothetical protein